jgi:hypothetical protein
MTEIIFLWGLLCFTPSCIKPTCSSLDIRLRSAWGVFYEAAGLFHLFALIDQTSPIMLILVLPMAVQEMVMALWLIVKSFNPSAFVDNAANDFHPSARAFASV